MKIQFNPRYIPPHEPSRGADGFAKTLSVATLACPVNVVEFYCYDCLRTREQGHRDGCYFHASV